jgi:hypothetical protein
VDQPCAVQSVQELTRAIRRAVVGNHQLRELAPAKQPIEREDEVRDEAARVEVRNNDPDALSFATRMRAGGPGDPADITTRDHSH